GVGEGGGGTGVDTPNIWAACPQSVLALPAMTGTKHHRRWAASLLVSEDSPFGSAALFAVLRFAYRYVNLMTCPM
ncbi:MAG: hypothetical protein ACJAUC_001972, partial [Planctomycetota bacterium]